MSFVCPSEKTTPDPTLSRNSVADVQSGRSARPVVAWQQFADSHCLLRRSVLRRLEQLQLGKLTLIENHGRQQFGSTEARDLSAAVSVRDRRFYRYLVLGGSIGAAEAYIRGYWDSPDLTATLRLFARNLDVAQSMERGVTYLLKPLRVALNALKRNTRRGSRKNISAHYDLSNDFFSLMLDRTMTYSSGIFRSETTDLEEASTEKYDRICRKLELTPSDRVLEIGSGWGGFAEHAARRYGCRVVTTTISNQQYEYAARRFQDAGLGNRISLLKQDYRDLTGQFDKIASIEMIESVGAEYLPQFFQKCSELLTADGTMALQTITIPEYRYESYRRSVDFIQRYIFPGGLLPSLGSIAGALGAATDLRIVLAEDFAQHYATTLAAWRQSFWQNIESIKSLGFDQTFIRTWNYYLCYCEAGFHERQIGVAQMLLAKPRSVSSALAVP